MQCVCTNVAFELFLLICVIEPIVYDKKNAKSKINFLWSSMSFYCWEMSADDINICVFYFFFNSQRRPSPSTKVSTYPVAPKFSENSRKWRIVKRRAKSHQIALLPTTTLGLRSAMCIRILRRVRKWEHIQSWCISRKCRVVSVIIIIYRYMKKCFIIGKGWSHYIIDYNRNLNIINLSVITFCTI